MNDSQTMMIHSWGSGSHFLKNELKLSLQGKQLVVVVANDKIQTFRWKLEFWKTYVLNHEFDGFPVLKNFSNEIGSDIYECNFLDICSEICYYQEELHNPVG